MTTPAGTRDDRARVERQLLDLAGPAYQLAVRVSGHAQDAEDIVQQAYLHALKALPPSLPPDQLRPWFFRVTVNAAKDYRKGQVRREKREALVTKEAHEAAATPWDVAARKEMLAALRGAVESLEPSYRVPVALCYEQGLTQREAAAVLDMPLSTFSKRLDSALEEVRVHLGRAGFAATPVVVIGALKFTAPAVPAGLTAALGNLVAGGAVAAKAAVAASAAKGAAGAALALKVAAGVTVATMLAVSGAATWRHLQPPALAEAAPAGPQPVSSPKPPRQEPVPTITPHGYDAKAVFEELDHKGLRVIHLGAPRATVVPVDLRFKPIEGRKFVEAVAAANNRKVAWFRDGKVAILQRGATDADVERLLADLRSPDAAQRRQAAWRAGWVEDVRVFEPLLAVAEDADAGVARQALRSLNRLGFSPMAAVCGEKALLFLQRAFEDQDPNATYFRTRSGAVTALGQVGGEKALALLGKALKDRDQSVVWEAESALGRSGDDKATPILAEALADLDHNVSQTALRALGFLKGEQALELLATAAQHPHAESARYAALEALGWRTEEKALALVEKALSDASIHIRGQAIRTLGRMGGDRAAVLLEQSLDNPDAIVRNTAASSLGHLESGKALALLERALADKEPGVRGQAAATLGHVGGDKALALLSKALKDPDQNVRLYAVVAVGSIGNAQALALLGRALDDQEEDLRLALVLVGELGHAGPEAVDVLEKLMLHKDEKVRKAAAATLGHIGSEKAMALVEKTLHDQDQSEQVRLGAIMALAQCDTEKAFDLLANALENDPGMLVRTEAVLTLGRAGSGEKVLPLLEKALEDREVRVRIVAAMRLGQIGCSDALLKALANEKDGNVRTAIISTLTHQFRDDPAVKEALKKVAPAPEAPPAPKPESVRPPPPPTGEF